MDKDFVIEILADHIRQRNETVRHHKDIMSMMPRPTIKDGFPEGYEAEWREVGKHRMAERALTALADDLGVGNEVYERVKDLYPEGYQQSREH